MIDIPAPVASVIDASIEFVYSFGPLAEKTLILVPYILTRQIQNVADASGMDVETISYVLGMFVCYPLGLIMWNIPYGYPRHVFSFLLGAFLLQFTLGVQWIHHFVCSLVAYAMMLALPRSSLKVALPTFIMVYLCLGHLHRQYINYLGWDLDFTGTHMVLTQKLYMIGFNLYDGQVLAKAAATGNGDVSKANRASQKCAKYALKEIPGFMEFMGYAFCFSSLLAGPATEYATYLGAIEGTVFNNPKTGKRGKIPSNLWPTLWPFAQSLFFLAVHLVLSGYFPLMDPTDPQKNTPYILSDDFLTTYSWPRRYLHCWLGLFALRERYYFAWKNAQGANNIWYAGLDGVDENGEATGWETCSNMDVLAFELAPDVQNMTKNWNKKTSNWLTRYVYIRTNGNLGAVYSMSAFWHGFYPGYYIFFLSVPLATFCDRLAKKKLSPRFNSSQWSLYGIVGTLATTICVNYMILAFVLLAGSWSLAVYKSHYYFGHVLCLLFYGVLTVLPTPKKKDVDGARKKA